MFRILHSRPSLVLMKLDVFGDISLDSVGPTVSIIFSQRDSVVSFLSASKCIFIGSNLFYLKQKIGAMGNC